MVDKVHAAGYDRIVLTGIGGTTFELDSIAFILKKYSTIPVMNLNAAEALIDAPTENQCAQPCDHRVKIR